MENNMKIITAVCAVGLVAVVGVASGRESESIYEYNQRRVGLGLPPSTSVPIPGSIAEAAQRRKDEEYLEDKEARRREIMRKHEARLRATPIPRYISNSSGSTMTTSTAAKPGGIKFSFSDEITTKGK